MKKFLRLTFIYLIFTISAMFLLDMLYTTTYSNSDPRTKFQLLRNKKNDTLHYPFIGSSRVDNGINPKIIENATQKSSLNLGFQSGKMRDIYTILKVFKAYNIQTETIFIQLDYNYNDAINQSTIIPYEIMPFINDNKVLNDYALSLNEGWALLNIPFYRYCQFEHKLGLREIILNLINKKSNIIATQGYHPLEGNNLKNDYELPRSIKDSNTYFDSIQKFITDNKYSVVYFTSPFSSKTKNLNFSSKLENKVNHLWNYTNSISDDNLFFDHAHLNKDGADEFSKMLAHKIVENSNKPQH